MDPKIYGEAIDNTLIRDWINTADAETSGRAYEKLVRIQPDGNRPFFDQLIMEAKQLIHQSGNKDFDQEASDIVFDVLSSVRNAPSVRSMKRSEEFILYVNKSISNKAMDFIVKYFVKINRETPLRETDETDADGAYNPHNAPTVPSAEEVYFGKYPEYISMLNQFRRSLTPMPRLQFDACIYARLPDDFTRQVSFTSFSENNLDMFISWDVFLHGLEDYFKSFDKKQRNPDIMKEVIRLTEGREPNEDLKNKYYSRNHEISELWKKFRKKHQNDLDITGF